MPEICRFYGIIIYIYFRDHQPPHFHAVYGDYEVLISIDDLAILAGQMPPRALGLVMEWANKHHQELNKVFEQAQQHQKPDRIEPLE